MRNYCLLMAAVWFFPGEPTKKWFHLSPPWWANVFIRATCRSMGDFGQCLTGGSHPPAHSHQLSMVEYLGEPKERSPPSTVWWQLLWLPYMSVVDWVTQQHPLKNSGNNVEVAGAVNATKWLKWRILCYRFGYQNNKTLWSVSENLRGLAVWAVGSVYVGPSVQSNEPCPHEDFRDRTHSSSVTPA